METLSWEGPTNQSKTAMNNFSSVNLKENAVRNVIKVLSESRICVIHLSHTVSLKVLFIQTNVSSAHKAELLKVMTVTQSFPIVKNILFLVATRYAQNAYQTKFSIITYVVIKHMIYVVVK